MISLPTFPIFGGWNFKASFLTRVSLVSGRVGRIAALAVAKAIAVVCAAWRTWQMPGEHSAMDCCQRSLAATQATRRTVAWASNRTVSWVNGPNGANVLWPCNGNGNGTFSSQPDWGGCPVWGRCIRRRPVNQRQWIVWSQIGPTGMSAIRAVVPPKPGVNGPSPSSPSMGEALPHGSETNESLFRSQLWCEGLSSFRLVGMGCMFHQLWKRSSISPEKCLEPQGTWWLWLLLLGRREPGLQQPRVFARLCLAWLAVLERMFPQLWWRLEDTDPTDQVDAGLDGKALWTEGEGMDRDAHDLWTMWVWMSKGRKAVKWTRTQSTFSKQIRHYLILFVEWSCLFSMSSSTGN